jgi:hypothetical protein
VLNPTTEHEDSADPSDNQNGDPNIFNMSDIPITIDEIISSIESLENKKTSDMSGFSTKRSFLPY